MNQIDLSTFNNRWYHPGGSALKRGLWYLTNATLLQGHLLPFYGLKRVVLRMFGACIGKQVIIKPGVNIKYPWNLSIGDNTWIGENVWIDNLAIVSIGSNVCLSQGAMLLCGNHDYKKSTFDLVVGEIHIENRTWIGAKAVICPGVTVGENTVLTVGSIATHDLKPNAIYQGNPASYKKERT